MSILKFKKLALIGLGLLGSSISHAARKGNCVSIISGADHSPEARNTAMRLGLVDVIYEHPAEAVEDADLIILCIPVGSYKSIAKSIGSVLKVGSIISDVGSVKSSVIIDVSPYLPRGVHFVPAHPIAGTEQSGPESGFATLFDSKWCILTPPDGTEPSAVSKLVSFWQSFGSNVQIMSAEHHDLVLAITSHLPHLIAYNIVKTADHLERISNAEVIKYSAGGFRDFTRIAASDPTMWRDIFLNNKEAVLEMLGRFTEDLTDLQRAIRYGDGDRMLQIFNNSRNIRQAIVDAGQDTNVPDFGRRPL
ncbi:MAG: Cyclohexadienyl dehydrogenase [Hyphomicrobiaceae bacterium hypho_1]